MRINWNIILQTPPETKLEPNPCGFHRSKDPHALAAGRAHDGAGDRRPGESVSLPLPPPHQGFGMFGFEGVRPHVSIPHFLQLAGDQIQRLIPRRLRPDGVLPVLSCQFLQIPLQIVHKASRNENNQWPDANRAGCGLLAGLVFMPTRNNRDPVREKACCQSEMTVPRMRFDGLKLLQINVEASLALRTAARRLNRLCGGLETAWPQF